jgi:transposase InsO family protein
MTAQLVTDALVMAIWRRGKPDALMHHSDRGPILQRAVPAIDGRQRHRLQYEPIGQLLHGLVPRRRYASQREGTAKCFLCALGWTFHPQSSHAIPSKYTWRIFAQLGTMTSLRK